MTRMMRLATLLAVLTALVLGCAARAPMTDSEFLGFCNSAGSKRSSCDNVGMCDAYMQAVGRPTKDYAACSQGCADVKRQQDAHRSLSCAGTVSAANDWCVRYCRTLYPE